MKVEFYYDSTVPCGSAFPCDNAKAVELVGQLAAKGVNAKAFDLKGEQVAFMTYNAAVTGPKSAVRADVAAAGSGFTVELSTDMPAFFASVDVEGIPGELDDNCFTLLPGAPRRLTFTPRAPVTLARLRSALTVRHLRNTYR